MNAQANPNRRWLMIGGSIALLLACWLLWAGYDALPTANRFLIAGRVVGISVCGGSQLVSFLVGLWVGRSRSSRQQEMKL
jgi:hypothetical protein